MPELQFDLDLISDTSMSAAFAMTIKKAALFTIMFELQMVRGCKKWQISQEQVFLCFPLNQKHYLCESEWEKSFFMFFVCLF